MLIDVTTRRLKVSKRGLCSVEENLHQPTCRIIDEYQGRAGRPAVFEPVMFAAVNLDRLPNARPPLSRLLNPG